MIRSNHFTDDEGRPAGGNTFGPGFAIGWQNGPMRDPDGSPREQNGAFVEDILAAARDRLQHYQTTQFHSAWNSRAIEYLDHALAELRSRTAARVAAGVEGTHEVGPPDPAQSLSG